MVGNLNYLARTNLKMNARRGERRGALHEEEIMPPLLLRCSVCSARLSRHVSKEVEEQDG